MTPTNHLALPDTEADILSLMMNKPDKIIPKVRMELREDDFFGARNRVLFSFLLEMHREGQPIDVTTVSPALQKKGMLEKVGGITAINAIYGKTLGIGAIDTYIGYVRERARRRKLIELMDVAIAQAADLQEDIDIRKFQSDMAEIAKPRHTSGKTMKEWRTST